MKRLIIFLATIFLVLTLNSTQGATITGETITGKITSQVVNINITVTVGAPTLSIISPENETYLTNTSLLLNYATTGVDTWYNLNKKHNTTINSPTYFNTSEGLHTLYLYTNNSNSTISKNVTFTVNMTKFVIIDDEYEEGEDDDEDQTRMGRHPKQGSSTDFLDYSYEDLQNLCNIILENADYGRIQFNEAINVTDDLDSSDNQVDLNTYTNISFNRIELNATALPNFNKQATLWLYNLNFTNPRILKDGSVCSSTICTEINYSGGTLEFNVTGFSVYSAEETPSSSSSSSTSTGGGGGSGWIISTTGDFEIEPEEIKISLKQGETQKKEIIIRNTGDKILTFNINKTKLKEFIYIDETEFEIEAGETKRIQVRFVVDADTIPNLYMGGLIISSETTEIEIPVAIEVESKGALFDVEAVILKKYKNILLGEELVFQLNLYNLGGGGKVDVTLEYIVKDLDGNEIIYEHEDLAIETQASHVVTLETPNNMELG